MNMRRTTMAAAAAAAAVMMTAGTASADTNFEKVYEADLGDTWHTADTRPAGDLTWKSTYGGALGSGAVVLDTPNSTSKVQLFTEAHDGTPLGTITELGYSTYQVTAPGPQLPALNMRVDLNDDDVVDTYLVYEPYADDRFYGNKAITNNEWQTWDAWHDGQSEWWASNATSTGVPGCGQATPCTMDTILAAHPKAVILSGGNELRSGSTPLNADFDGGFGFNQGSGNTGVKGAADALHIATQGSGSLANVDVTYDFEPTVTLSSKTQCKSGGWATSTHPEFRNQGDCVSHFARK